MMYLTGTGVAQDQNRALGYFQVASELGDPLASYKLGCFYDGQYKLLKVDAERALDLKLVAANAGYALAQQDVAVRYARRGDFSQALGWLARAASEGIPEALALYASVHNGTPGVEKDPVSAAAYFRLFLAASGGTEQQREWLKAFESKLSPAQLDAADAIVTSFRAKPTALTTEALAGLTAADALIAATDP